MRSPASTVFICDNGKETMIEAHDYQIQVIGTGIKRGLLESTQDGLPSLEVASPPEFGGPDRVWSPEHLFVASVAACLMTTFRSIAANSGVEVVEYRDESVGHLQRGEDGLYSIDRVTLRPTVVVSSDSKPERALRLLEKAERVCLISRSVSSETVLEPRVIQAHQVGT
jgi:organic hydroperoxide reductase OsmC/OhrA